VDVFAALADPVRRSLLRAISDGPTRVVDLAAGRPISRPAISKHLRVLTEAGLVEASERGRERHYSLTLAGLAPVADLLDDLAQRSGPWLAESALDALETEVRRTSRERRTQHGPTHRHEESA
jgi:DNA-binding transcriptional ArsR family regulator